MNVLGSAKYCEEQTAMWSKPQHTADFMIQILEKSLGSEYEGIVSAPCKLWFLFWSYDIYDNLTFNTQ